MKKPDFAEFLASYLSKHLPLQQGASTNTIKSYRDSFTIFLRYCRDELRIKPEKLTMQMLNRKMLEDYLLWLEKKRDCGVSTRNHRLTTLHAFLRYVSIENPEHIDICTDLLTIKLKHASVKAVDYLTIDELKTIFSQPDLRSAGGKRDLTILTLLYDSGARVQELIDLRLRDIRCQGPATVKLSGKGNKARIVPLMPDTARIVSEYIVSFLFSDPEQHLFINKKHEKLSRSGIEFIISKYVKMANSKAKQLSAEKITPHVFRHSKAMHLVQAGVNIIYIRDFLGHVSVQTTEIYAKADSNAKRKALEQASKNIVPESKFTKNKENELLIWLKNLV
ncbi:MAG: integrase [Negativicutes bacterium]|nr:integrase [Negativicutes bacterium]